MCLTVPRRVAEVKEDKARLQDGRWVKTVLVGRVKPGDFVLAQADMAVEKISSKKARAMEQIIG